MYSMNICRWSLVRRAPKNRTMRSWFNSLYTFNSHSKTFISYTNRDEYSRWWRWDVDLLDASEQLNSAEESAWQPIRCPYRHRSRDKLCQRPLVPIVGPTCNWMVSAEWRAHWSSTPTISTNSLAMIDCSNWYCWHSMRIGLMIVFRDGSNHG